MKRLLTSALLCFAVLCGNLVSPQVVLANQTPTAAYCTPPNSITNGSPINAVPVYQNQQHGEVCGGQLGDFWTDGPLFSGANFSYSGSTLAFTIPAMTWVASGQRVYSPITPQVAPASATSYWWLTPTGSGNGSWSTTSTNTPPTVYSILEYTVVANSSGITSVTYPTQATFSAGSISYSTILASSSIGQSGTNLSSCFYCYGTAGSASAGVLRFSNATTGSGYTSFGAANDGTVQSVQNSVLSIGDTGTKVLALNGSGDLGVLRNLYASAFYGSGAGLSSGTVPETAITLPAGYSALVPYSTSPSPSPIPSANFAVGGTGSLGGLTLPNTLNSNGLCTSAAGNVTAIGCAGQFTVNILSKGAKCDDTTDDSTALEAAISAVSNAGGGIVLIPPSANGCLIDSAVTFPTTGGSSTTTPSQVSVRITGSGGAPWDPGLGGTAPTNASILDLRYTGADTLHPAKIDTRGAGSLEIDHLALIDRATDDFLFMQTTNTTINIHDNYIVGDPSENGTADRQDFLNLGSSGYWASSLSATGGSATVTIGAGDPPFNAGMVGWQFIYSATTAQRDTNPYASTIATYISPTSVTLTSPAPTSLPSTGIADYFAVGNDSHAPFHGYNSRLVHNVYAHIRRAAIWGNYANAVVAQDEIIDLSSGCSTANIPDCGFYYFDRTGSVRVGNIIRAPQGEISHYPYEIYLQAYALRNDFQDIVGDDGTQTNLGGVFAASTTVANNRFSVAQWQPFLSSGSINTTIAASISAGSQTVTPASMTGITTSTPVLIDSNSYGIQEWVTPTATTGSTFTATFINAHTGGSTVKGYGPFFSGPGINNAIDTNGDIGTESTLIPYSPILGGSTTYPTITTVTAPLVMPNAGTNIGIGLPQISDGSASAYTRGLGSIIMFGTPGSPAPILAFANDSGLSTQAGFSELLGGGDTIAGNTATCWEIAQIAGSALIGQDCSGNLLVRGNILAGTTISANGAYTGGPNTGDIGAGRSASCGVYWFGIGSSTAKGVDYGCTTSGVFTFNGQISAKVGHTCSATSGVPCSFTWNCTISSSGTACSSNPTQAVPAASACGLTLTSNPVASSVLMEPYVVSLVSATLTIGVTAPSAISGGASPTGNGLCL